ncbi:MAG: hypothetical protein WC477_07735 [Patescibacteria group bacterium]
MQKTKGDLFECEPKSGWVVISTNVGWTRDGSNVMGAGLAKTAAMRWPNLPVDYGAWCQKFGGKMFVSKKNRVICLPSKPLNKVQPWASWRSNSCPDLIRESYRQLKDWALKNPKETVKLAPFGAQNGKLPMDMALKLVEDACFPDNVVLVLR